MAPPRPLAYYGAHEIGHEIGHDFIAERIGAIANWRLPVWIREGLADYIAFGGDVDIDGLLAALRRGDPDPRPEALRHLRALPAARGLHA